MLWLSALNFPSFFLSSVWLKSWGRVSLTPHLKTRRSERSSWHLSTSPGKFLQFCFCLEDQNVCELVHFYVKWSNSIESDCFSVLKCETSLTVNMFIFRLSSGYLCPSWSAHSFLGYVHYQVNLQFISLRLMLFLMFSASQCNKYLSFIWLQVADIKRSAGVCRETSVRWT